MARTSSHTVQSVLTSRCITPISSRAICRQHLLTLEPGGGLIGADRVVERQLILGERRREALTARAETSHADNELVAVCLMNACQKEVSAMVTVTATGHEVCACAVADWPAVLAVINADQLPGQPTTTLEMLGEAVRGRSPVDGEFWDELREVKVDVLCDPDHTVRGVVSYATRPRDGAGLILWLHGRENHAVVTGLVEHALNQLAGCPTVEAFSFATALGLGLEALPVRHRPVTDRVLRAAGFAGEDLWRYMRRSLPATELPHAAAVRATSPDPGTRQLSVRDDGQTLAEATIGVPVAGIGQLWWISVESPARPRGLGRALLGSALDLLSGLGAEEVILYVDDDDTTPGSDRSRAAANRLYDSAGFCEVDRLVSYCRTRRVGTRLWPVCPHRAVPHLPYDVGAAGLPVPLAPCTATS